jgi:hypothetical protein
MITLEVQHGELVEGLTKQAADAGITHGAIVSMSGAVNSFALSTMPAYDATKDVETLEKRSGLDLFARANITHGPGTCLNNELR